MIDAYLAELARELKLQGVRRTRALAEAAEHLHASADELAAGGMSRAEAAQEALRRFGSAPTVARAFAEVAAGRSARRATGWALASLAAYGTAAVIVVTRAPRYLLDFPQGVPSWFGLQLALVAAVVCVVRRLRWRREAVLAPEGAAALAAAALVVAATVTVTALAEVSLAVTRPAGGWQAGAAESLAFMSAAFFAVTASLVGAAAAVRTRVRAGAPLAADVAALSPALGRLAGRVASRPQPALGLCAAAASLMVATSQLLSNDFAHHASVVIDAAVVGLLEAVAIVACYAVFGRTLGLRPSRRPA